RHGRNSRRRRNSNRDKESKKIKENTSIRSLEGHLMCPFSFMPKKTCYQYSLDLLARRDYSKYKLTQKLRSREFTDEEIEDTIENLVKKNYLREEEYQRMRVQGMLIKGYANSFIKQKCAM